MKVKRRIVILLLIVFVGLSTTVYIFLQIRTRHAQARALSAAQARAVIEEAARQQLLARQYEELTIQSLRRSDDVLLRNLELENHIEALEGKPIPNRIAIASIQNKWISDDFYKSEEDQISTQIALLKRGDAYDRAAIESMEALLEAIAAQRMANARGNEQAKKDARKAVDQARQRAIAVNEQLLKAKKTGTH